ncbi:hypothetical protein D0812_11600 [Vibrio owensii]|uniref:Uncharacterized protein n=1 Tax=Vibrio owensii TaxID=696485 RepID=A0AAP9KAC6_9VIBR|nr:hypothetical protein [Vibrio owensii]AYO15024.1 hypothetical protein D0812_11600 [Vibrio owensii]QGH47305.1 hypothetical protein APZ19_09485 [Vibrio owensii]
MTTKKKVFIYFALLVALLSIPWINALTSSFQLEGEFGDRGVNFIGSHGRYKLEANYYSNTHVVNTGYYASLFDTLYLIQLRRDKVANDDRFDINEFLRGHRRVIVFKLDKQQDGEYQLKLIEEDPRKGIAQYPVAIEGDLGFL